MVAPALSDPRSGPSGVLDHPIPDPTPPSNYYTADHHLPTALARYYAADPEGWRWADMSLLRAAREIAAPDLSEAMAAVYAAVLLTAEAGFAQEREDGDADYAARSAERYAAHVVAPALAALERHGDEPAEGVADLIAAAVSS